MYSNPVSSFLFHILIIIIIFVSSENAKRTEPALEYEG
jgi:hypothetical protein